MKSAVIQAHGTSDTIILDDRPFPKCKEDQVLIQIKACGLNHLDLWVRKGVRGHVFPLPLVPGSDIAGVVSQVGENVKNFKAGDRIVVDPGVACGVCEFCKLGEENLCNSWGLLGESADGGCQEYLAVDQKQVHLLSNKISFEQAACMPVAYVTAWQMLVEKAKIKNGETILIHAAGSGVSVACIQIAKLFNCQIFVTSTSEEKLQRAKALGAHRFINIQKNKFRESVRLLSSKRGVDIVVDHVGQPTIAESIKCLRKGGRLVSCGATAGSEVTLDWKIIFFKNIQLLGSTYGTRKDFATVLKLFEEGKLSAQVNKTFKLEELSLAHQLLEDQKIFGKIVILF